MESLKLIEEYRENLIRVIQFGLISLSGLILENFFLFLLVEFGGLDLIIGKLLGAEASIALMFFLNNRYTFKKRPGVTFKRFLKSNLVRSGGIAIALIVLKIGTSMGLWYILANTIGIIVGFVFNYVMESVYTWAEE